MINLVQKLKDNIFPAGFTVLTVATLFTGGFSAHWTVITVAGYAFIAWRYSDAHR